MITQETFNKIVHGIIAQGGAAIDPEFQVCMFRAPSGRKCAAGLLIPDHLYTGEMDTTHVGDPLIWDAIGLPDDQMQDVLDLQAIHDEASLHPVTAEPDTDAEFFKRWIPAMQEFAKDRGLTIPS